MIYASLMLEKFPNKGLEFFKYMYAVRMAASRGYSLGWVNYDEQYRALLGGLSTWSCGCCACQPPTRTISVLAMSKDNPAILPPLPPLSNNKKSVNYVCLQGNL
jgi:hypothetical protein